LDNVDRLGTHLTDVLCGLSESLEAAGLPFAVVGAAALLLHNVHLERTTRDLDLAVSIAGGFGAIRPVLHGAGLSDTRIEHRFRTPDGDEIDVLPIDQGRKPPHEIRLAGGERIRAVGLAEAIAHAVPVDVGTRRVPVAPLALLVANKLYAAASQIRPHDLEDAYRAMETYAREGTRRFDVDYDRHPELTYETAGAFLAGFDSAAMMSIEASQLVDAAIESLGRNPRLGHRFDRGEARLALVLAFGRGLRAGIQGR
jgi:predicted nucleotidyltransferase